MKNTQVLVFSYAGRVTATMTVDPAQFDAELFSRAYETEFRQLAEELGVPDGGPRGWSLPTAVEHTREGTQCVRTRKVP